MAKVDLGAYRQEVAAMKAKRAAAMAPLKVLAVGNTGTVSIVEVSRNRVLAHIYQRRFVVAAASRDFLTLAYEDRNGVEARTAIRRTDANRRLKNGGDWLRFRFDGLEAFEEAARAAKAAEKATRAAKTAAEAAMIEKARQAAGRKPRAEYQTDEERKAAQRAYKLAWTAAKREKQRAAKLAVAA